MGGEVCTWVAEVKPGRVAGGEVCSGCLLWGPGRVEGVWLWLGASSLRKARALKPGRSFRVLHSQHLGCKALSSCSGCRLQGEFDSLALLGLSLPSLAAGRCCRGDGEIGGRRWGMGLGGMFAKDIKM